LLVILAVPEKCLMGLVLSAVWAKERTTVQVSRIGINKQ